MPADKVDRHERLRTVEWDEPSVNLKASTTMSGREFLAAIRDHELPPSPISRLLGYRVREVGDGYASVELEPGEYLYNPICSVHGGVLCTLLDTAMACAVHTKLAAGQAYVTVGITVSFVRSVTAETGVIHAEGRVVHVGASVATAEGEVLNGNGKLYAHAISTFTIFSARKGGPDRPR